MKETAINVIKEGIEKKGIGIVKIILYGSRARGDFKEDSDWDLLVIVDRDLSFQERQTLVTEIYRKLAKIDDSSYEIRIKPKENFEKMRNYIGNISYDADKEGVLIWMS